MARQRFKKCDFDWYTPSLNNRRIGNAKTLKSAAASSLQSNKSGKLKYKCSSGVPDHFCPYKGIQRVCITCGPLYQNIGKRW